MAQSPFDDTFSQLKTGFKRWLNSEPPEADWSENRGEQTESEFKFNETASNKVRAVIDDFIVSAPIIESAGFRIRDLEVELGIIPKLIPHFEKFKDTDDDHRQSIIEQVSDKRLLKLLLTALFKADNFQRSLNMGSMEFTGIEIEITAIPAVRLKYQNPRLMAGKKEAQPPQVIDE